jgi:hypothetical protein
MLLPKVSSSLSLESLPCGRIWIIKVSDSFDNWLTSLNPFFELLFTFCILHSPLVTSVWYWCHSVSIILASSIDGDQKKDLPIYFPRIIYFKKNIYYLNFFYKNLSKKYYSVKIEVLTSNL